MSVLEVMLYSKHNRLYIRIPAAIAASPAQQVQVLVSSEGHWQRETYSISYPYSTVICFLRTE
jgi:hypothetical protein